ncbi:MAG: protein kinase domain-containing protein [Polyangiaceae bacterium]
MKAAAAKAERIIAGKYRVVRALGQGGMGAVLVAWHDLLDVPVAIKVLSADLARNAQTVSRFLREAQAVARLKSEHVARVMDLGTTEQGQPFIVMELLEGQDLEHRLEHGPLPVPLTIDYLLQATEAVAQAHAIGIVHRDLKPANLFASTMPGGREVLKVLDFGIAKLVDGSSRMGGAPGADRVLTGEHTTVGSPSYMAPEQVRGEAVDGRTDIWALGAIVYELVTGRTAFAGASNGETFAAILHTSPPPLCSLRPEAPAELEAVVSRCLQREAAERYADLAEFARAIAPFGSGAYAGYTARVEQTLRRASAMFDADQTTMTRLKKLDAAGLEAAAFLAAAAPPVRSVALGAVTQDASRKLETLPTPALAPAPAAARTSLRWAAVAGAILCAGIGAAALLAIRHGDVPAPAEGSTATAIAPGPAPEIPPSTQGATEPPAPGPSVAASPLPAPVPSATPARSAPAHRAKPREAKPILPGVLRSAD